MQAKIIKPITIHTIPMGPRIFKKAQTAATQVVAINIPAIEN
jgi:hypothetical protein